MYITEDTGKIYVDIASGPFEDDPEDKVYRIVLNGQLAEALHMQIDGEDVVYTIEDIKAIESNLEEAKNNINSHSSVLDSIVNESLPAIEKAFTDERTESQKEYNAVLSSLSITDDLVAKNISSIDALQTSINGINTRQDSMAEDIEALQEEDNSVNGILNAYSDRLNALENTVSLPSTYTVMRTYVDDGDAALASSLETTNTALNGVSTQVDNQETAIGTLRDDLTTETSARESATETLNQAIIEEAATARAAEAKHTEDIDKNTTSINGLTTNLDTQGARIDTIDGDLLTEINNARAAEELLQDAINTTDGKLNQLIEKHDTDVESILNRFSGLEKQITDNIDKTGSVSQKLDNEITRSTTADADLDTAIKNETSRASDAEAELLAKIDAEIGRSTDKDNSTAVAIDAINGNIETIVERLTTIQNTDTTKSMRDVAEEVINSLVINSDDESDTLINKLQEIVAWLDGAQEGETLGDILDDIGELRTQLWGENEDYTSLDTVGGALKDIGTLQMNVNNLNSGLETLHDTVHERPSTLTSGSYGHFMDESLGYGQSFAIPYITVDDRGRIVAAKNRHMTIPASDNTDTKVTAVENHYAPTTDSTAELGADAASTTAATWNSTSLVTGVNLQRDAAGHVTGITVDSIRMPANPDTDTHWTSGLITGLSATSQENGDISAFDDNTVYLNLVENGVVRNSHKIVGSGATKVTSDANGIITISSTDTNTTYGAATASTAGLMSAADKSKLDGIAAGANNYTYTLPTATSSTLGGVKIGSNITVSSGTISLSKANVTAALGYTPPTANTDTNVTTAAQSSGTIYVTGCTGATTGGLQYNSNVYITGNTLRGAAWNDYAEFRESDTLEPGRVVCENGDDTLSLSTKRLQPGAEIVSDTFGFIIGETDIAKTPIAVAGRVLVYPYEDRNTYKPGDAVCAAPGGTVSKMTREEIMTYPERIVGTVSAIPEYKTWGEGNVSVNGRIWIKVK